MGGMQQILTGGVCWCFAQLATSLSHIVNMDSPILWLCFRQLMEQCSLSGWEVKGKVV